MSTESNADDTVRGEIIAVQPVMTEGGTWPVATVIYERDGQRYRGCQFSERTPDGVRLSYYFGGAAHLPHLANIDEALEQGFPTLKKTTL